MLKLLWNILLAWFSHSILWWRKNLSETIFGMKFQVSFAKMFFLCNVVLCWSYYAYPIVYFSEERICSKVFFEWNFQVVLLKQGEKFFSALIVISQTNTHFSTHISIIFAIIKINHPISKLLWKQAENEAVKNTNKLQSRWQYFVISWSKYYFKCHGSNEGAILKLMSWVKYPNHLVVSSEPANIYVVELEQCCVQKTSSLLTYQVIL